MDTYSWLVREDIQKNHILTLNRVLEAEKGLHHFADIFNNDSKELAMTGRRYNSSIKNKKG
jgi:hypothetical protein